MTRIEECFSQKPKEESKKEQEIEGKKEAEGLKTSDLKLFKSLSFSFKLSSSSEIQNMFFGEFLQQIRIKGEQKSVTVFCQN